MELQPAWMLKSRSYGVKNDRTIFLERRRQRFRRADLLDDLAVGEAVQIANDIGSWTANPRNGSTSKDVDTPPARVWSGIQRCGIAAR
jgi:hypothetical protein